MRAAAEILGGLLGIESELQVAHAALTALEGVQPLYRLVFESVQEGVWQTDISGTTVHVNPQTAGMLGRSVQGMQGTALSLYLCSDEQTVNDLERIRLCTPGQYQTRYRRKDGSILSARVNTKALTDANGGSMGAVVFLTAVNDLVAASEGAHPQSLIHD